MHHLRTRQMKPVRRTFAPEASGDFPVVAPERIAELRRRMDDRMKDQEWETVEDVVTSRCDA